MDDKKVSVISCRTEDIFNPEHGGPLPPDPNPPEPDEVESAALDLMFKGYQRLRDHGWQNIIHCPKDGSMFLAIEAGSTGVHKCTYDGKWPNGHWWTHDGDMWPARPILFKPLPAPAPQEESDGR